MVRASGSGHPLCMEGEVVCGKNMYGLKWPGLLVRDLKFKTERQGVLRQSHMDTPMRIDMKCKDLCIPH